MSLTTSSSIVLRDSVDAVGALVSKGPKIAITLNLSTISASAPAVVTFTDNSDVPIVADTFAVTLTELNAIDSHCGDAYNAIMDALEQLVRTRLLALTANASATITYTGRA